MVYARGVAADEKLHAAFHAGAGGSGASGGSSKRGGKAGPARPAAPAGVGPRLPRALPPGLAEARPARPDGSLGRILHWAPPAGHGRHPRPHPAVAAALGAAEAALGSAPGWLFPGGGGGDGGGAPPSAPRPHVFLAEGGRGGAKGSSGRVVGVAVVEALGRGAATLAWWVAGGDGAAVPAPAPSSTPPPTLTTHPLGVRGIWVAPGCRRAGLAGALLDAARAGGVLPWGVVPRGGLAFSQPTAAGAGLATGFGGGEGGRFAVYE